MASSNADFYEAKKFTPPPYEEPPRQRGCFFYGCLIAGILSLLLLIAVGLIFFVLYRWFSRVRRGIHGHGTARAAQGRDARREAPDAEGAGRTPSRRPSRRESRPSPWSSTADDLNALIEESPDLKGQGLR